MNLITVLFACFLSFTYQGWLTDLEKAKAEAKTSHKQILLNFSGSDWCGPCIKMKREVFQSEPFNIYAADKLVLVNADFPRQEKNKLNREQTIMNEALAEQYNKAGTFPLTLLLDENGNVLKKWAGNPGLSPEQFIGQLQAVRE